jgi:hypothetical protein
MPVVLIPSILKFVKSHGLWGSIKLKSAEFGSGCCMILTELSFS